MMTIHRSCLALACAAALALGACSDTKTVRVGDPDELAAERRETAAAVTRAEAAEKTLRDLRDSLGAAQDLS